MSSVEEKCFLRLIKFSYDLSLKVTRTFMETNILTRYNNSFVEFLDVNKHKLYHLWVNNTRCCACKSNELLQENKVIDKGQFIKLYDINGTTSPGHFKYGKGKSIVQRCLCSITCLSSCSLDNLDIALIHTIIKNSQQLEADEDMWLQAIKDTRNKLAHVVSTTNFDQGRLEKWWGKLEGSVLGLAGKVGFHPYAKSIEDQIKLLKIADLDRNEVEEFLCQIKEENKKVSGDLKNEIIKACSENKEEHNETRTHFDQGIKDLEYRLFGQGFKDLEDHIVGRILQRISPHNPAATTHRKDIQFLEVSCQVTGENIDKELISRSLNQQEQLDKMPDFRIAKVKRACIILKLTTSTDIFHTAATIRGAVIALIERIIQAGEVRTSQRHIIEFYLVETARLGHDFMVIEMIES